MLIEIAKAGWKRSNVRPFMMEVGYYLFRFRSEANEETLHELEAEEYSYKYAYNLVNLRFGTVSDIVSNIYKVNDCLREESFPTLDPESLEAILYLAPIWIAAEYRFSIRNEFMLPSETMDNLPDNLQRRIRCNYEAHQNRECTDTALVEYSYFALNKTSNHNLWVGDTGASCHMTNNLDGMINIRDNKSPIQIGTGEAVESTQIGDKRLRIVQSDGEINNIILKDCKYVPELFTNLFSITKALDNDWKISNEGIKMQLSKDDFSFEFDQVLRTETGAITAVEMVPRMDHMNITLERGTKININKLHLLLGHACQSTLRKTASVYGITLQGDYGVCPDCALAKARQQNVPKETTTIATKAGERLYLDISSTKATSFGSAKFWLLIVDQHTDFCWSAFLQQKNHLADRVLGFIKSLKTNNNIEIENIRCDNAGENVALQKLLETASIKVNFEYTPPGNPQFNGVVERKFKTLYDRVRSLLNSARLSQELRDGLWAEAAQYATEVENILVTNLKNVSSWKQFYGTEPPLLKNIRQFAEVAIVEEWSTRGMRSKLDNRGKAALYIGRTKQHAQDVYRFLNLTSKRIICSRDVTWLNKTYATYAGIDGVQVVDNETNEPLVVVNTATNTTTVVAPITTPQVQEDTEIGADVQQAMDNVVIVPNPVATPESTANETVIETVPTTVIEAEPRVTRELTRLDANIETVDMSETRSLRSGRVPDAGNVMVALSDICLFAKETLNDVSLNVIDPKTLNPTQYKDYFAIPSNFNEAWNHPCPFQQEKWRDGIMKEFDKMDTYNVYTKVKRDSIPKGRKCVKCKWVFDIKRNGVFRARLVACGYSQQPGIDFTESYSPVINDSVFRCIIVIELLFRLVSKIIDIETAFLNGELEEEIYMDAPPGYNATADECVRLGKSLYGLVQSARQFFKKFSEVLKQLGMTQSNIEPCVFIQQTEIGMLIVAIYVDDCYVIGTEKSISKFIVDIQAAGFKIKVEDKPTDYLSCEIKFDEKKTCAWLGQPHLIKKMERNFSELVKGNYRYLTPGTPNYNVIRPQSEDEKIDPERQKIYRSAVGTLLQFVKHSRPDIANPVRELSKCMDGATEAAYKEMCRVMKFVLDTREFGLKLQPSVLLKDDMVSLTMYTDSDWAGDKETRRSISGFIIFFMDCPIVWRSKQQSSVTLSSTEAEYVALSEAAKEIKFISQVLVSMGMKVKYPIIVKVDNVGAIFMSENISATNRTRHVDARYHFVYELVEDGLILIQFVCTKDNKADPFTKNVKTEIYENSIDSYMVSKDGFSLREGVMNN